METPTPLSVKFKMHKVPERPKAPKKTPGNESTEKDKGKRGQGLNKDFRRGKS